MQRLMRSRVLALQTNYVSIRGLRPEDDPKNWIPNEDPRISTQNRYNDEPEPKEHDMIVTHYLKHHPLYEFRNFKESHVDPYRYWLHGRADYYNTETYPSEISPWEKGSKAWHMTIIAFPFLALFFVPIMFDNHLKQKNMKMRVIGVFS